MTELKNSNSAFALAMKEVFTAGEKQEALSAKVLFAMIEMDASFGIEWVETFYKAENKAKTEIIETALADLSPEYSSIVEAAEISVKEIRQETNAAKKSRMELEKASAQSKRKAAQNMIRNVAQALVLFRVGVPNEKKEGEFLAIDKWTLTDRKRVRFSVKGEGWHNTTGYTFKDLMDMGKNLAAQKNWIVVKVSQAPSKGSTGAASEGTNLTETAKDIGALAQTLNTITAILMSKNMDSLSEAEEEALRMLEETIIKRTYGDDKGKIDFETMVEYYTDPKKASKAA